MSPDHGKTETGAAAPVTGYGPRPAGSSGTAATPEETVLRRTQDGWRVGADELPDLTCAMVLADLLAAELLANGASAGSPSAGSPSAGSPSAGSPSADSSAGAPPPAGSPPAAPSVSDEARRLKITVSQLQHALTARIRVEQAIGVLAERNRVRPRQAFEQLRSAARNRGRRVIDIAADVVASATNPLLQLPDELSRQRSAPRNVSRPPRRAIDAK